MQKNFPKFIFISFLFISFHFSFADTIIQTNEKQALIDMYDSLDGENWSSCKWKKEIFSKDLVICKLCGIICENPFSNIISLNLRENNLKGILPSSIGNLIYLQSLDLSINKM